MVLHPFWREGLKLCKNQYITVNTTILLISFTCKNLCVDTWKKVFSIHSALLQHSCMHGRRKDSFQGGAKVVEFVFSLSKLRKQPSCLKISKSRKGANPLRPPSDAHACSRSLLFSFTSSSPCRPSTPFCTSTSFSTCALKSPERIEDALGLVITTLWKRSGCSALDFWPYTCMKHREQINKLNRKMCNPPSGMHS